MLETILTQADEIPILKAQIDALVEQNNRMSTQISQILHLVSANVPAGSSATSILPPHAAVPATVPLPIPTENSRADVVADNADGDSIGNISSVSSKSNTTMPTVSPRSRPEKINTFLLMQKSQAATQNKQSFDNWKDLTIEELVTSVVTNRMPVTEERSNPLGIKKFGKNDLAIARTGLNFLADHCETTTEFQIWSSGRAKKFPWQNDDEERAMVKKLAKSLAVSAKTWINSDEGGKNQPSKDSKKPRKRKMGDVSNVKFGVLSKRLKECVDKDTKKRYAVEMRNTINKKKRSDQQ